MTIRKNYANMDSGLWTPEEAAEYERILEDIRAHRALRRQLGLKPGQVVYHMDGDPTNNAPANLRIIQW